MSALKLAFLVSRIAHLMTALEVGIALQICLCALVCPMDMPGGLAHA